MRYRDEKFYWTYQRGVRWPDDYIGPDSMTRWIIEKSVGFTDVGLLRISESVRAYTYLILSSHASARSSIIENTTSALTAQSACLNNFENVVNRRVDIREDIKRHQDTLSYASSKVHYCVGQSIYMLPSDMNLKIKTGTVEYNNKILISDGKFSLEKNDEVILTAPPWSGDPLGPVMKSHAQTATNSNNVLGPRTPLHGTHTPTITHGVAERPQAHRAHKNQEPKTITHNDEKIALVLALASGFAIWNMFR